GELHRRGLLWSGKRPNDRIGKRDSGFEMAAKTVFERFASGGRLEFISRTELRLGQALGATNT
ncbi:MAG: hypothetical protein NTU88_10825, partial [Armatimonadetes bacterium]|nr:hypothetical protein [Armatimonadota bacterium]